MEVKVDRRSQILEAAFEEFAEKGFAGSTIKSIASAAGLRSPTLIYHYFPDKESLFQEVLESKAAIIKAVTDLAPSMDLPPEKVLPKIGRAYLDFDESNVPQVFQLAVGEALRRPEVAELFIEHGPRRVLEFLKRYLDRQVELGRLRSHDTRSSSRAFIGMLIPQIISKAVFPALNVDGLTDDQHLETAIEIFLKGLKPEG
jgi:TetR/AcrR family transcriptional regulator